MYIFTIWASLLSVCICACLAETDATAVKRKELQVNFDLCFDFMLIEWKNKNAEQLNTFSHRISHEWKKIRVKTFNFSCSSFPFVLFRCLICALVVNKSVSSSVVIWFEKLFEFSSIVKQCSSSGFYNEISIAPSWNF